LWGYQNVGLISVLAHLAGRFNYCCASSRITFARQRHSDTFILRYH